MQIHFSRNREPLIPVTARAQGRGKVTNLPNGQTSLIGLRLIGMMSSCVRSIKGFRLRAPRESRGEF